MILPRFKAAVLLPSIVLAVVVVYQLLPSEPSYEGKTVNQWLEEFDRNASEARLAVRQMGNRALPRLMSELRVNDSAWKLRLVSFARKQSLIKIPYTPDVKRRDRAIQACAALGLVAKPAIAALGEALGHGSGAAIQVLESFGPDAVPALTKALTNAPGCGAPYGTAQALGRLGAQARTAVTNLAWEMEHYRISYPRTASALALASISQELIEKANQPDCQEVIYARAALIRGLSNTNHWTRRAAVEALAVLQTNAPEAIPALFGLLDDPYLEVRQSATNALKTFGPLAIVKAGL